jgi:hypothetical protein
VKPGRGVPDVYFVLKDGEHSDAVHSERIEVDAGDEQHTIARIDHRHAHGEARDGHPGVAGECLRGGDRGGGDVVLRDTDCAELAHVRIAFAQGVITIRAGKLQVYMINKQGDISSLISL